MVNLGSYEPNLQYLQAPVGIWPLCAFVTLFGEAWSTSKNSMLAFVDPFMDRIWPSCKVLWSSRRKWKSAIEYGAQILYLIGKICESIFKTFVRWTLALGPWATSKKQCVSVSGSLSGSEKSKHGAEMVCLIVKKMVVLLSNITEQSAVVPVDPFLGGIGNGHLVERSSSRSRRGKCVPWEFPLFSGWPRMPSVRMAELEGSWWLDIFPLSTPPTSPLFCLPASVLHQFPLLSPQCALQCDCYCTWSPSFGETQISRHVEGRIQQHTSLSTSYCKYFGFKCRSVVEVFLWEYVILNYFKRMLRVMRILELQFLLWFKCHVWWSRKSTIQMFNIIRGQIARTLSI